MKKLPYGISDFKRLHREQYFYVDKTRYIELLEDYDAPYIFFLRPRRFGKSLLLSTLSAYYDVNMTEEPDDPFEGLYIADHPTQFKNGYHILHFDFSGINTSTKDRLLDDFTKKILASLDNFTTHYHIDVHFDRKGMPSSVLHSFLNKVQHRIHAPLYVLIDEYDHFANELLSFQVDTFEEVISKTGFVRKWYEVLKIGTGMGTVARIFATGISPLTLDSLTSGFNIASNLTRHKQFNAMLGFTQEEVRWLFEAAFPDLPQKEFDTILPDLMTYYNGYLFNEDAGTRMFNSDMVLYYLVAYRKDHEPPKDVIDTNISSDYAKLRRLFALKNKERNYGILRELLDGETPKATITREFSLAKRFTRDDFLSLLFYLGFLTIKEAGRALRVILEVPNYVIKELYFDFFEELLTQNVELETSDIIEGIEDLAFEGRIEGFLRSIETALEQISFRDFMKFDEKYVKLVMLTYLMLSKIYYVKSEYEVQNGYLDILLLRRSSIPVKYEVVLEIKYLKKTDYDDNAKRDKLLQNIIQEARTQLEQYQQVDELKDNPRLKKWILVFAGNICVHSEEMS